MRPIRRRLHLAAAALLATSLAAVVGPSGPAAAAPTDAAFNNGTGALNVDYAGYLSKHDIVYNRPNTNPLHGLTVGNGRTGAMVWHQNGLSMQVSGVDLAQQSTYAAGVVNLFSNPQLDTGYTTYQQRLSLYDGTLTTKYDSNRTVTIMGSPNSEVMGVHVEDSRPGVSSVGLDLSLWDPNTVQNIADVPNLQTWRTVSTFADAAGVGLSRGQADPNNFGYTLAATVEGAGYTSQVVDGTRVRLNITPTSSYTIWFTAASRINSPGLNSVTQARNQLAAVKSTGYGTTLANYRDWWHAFWAKSFVQYSNAGGDADYLENAYYLATYMIAAGGYGNYPVHFINGVFRATQDNSKWSNGYWYWNQRDVYNSFLAASHVDLMSTFNRLYSRNYGALKAYTQTRYGIDGLWVPETMGWDGNARGTVNSENYPNGMTNNTNGVFEYLGIHLAAMNESLMQSYDDRIRVFPAIPGDSSFSGKFTLLAKDGFVVSAEREASETKYVGLRSLHGKQARVVNPWGTQQIRVRRTSDGAILATTTAAEVTFATAAGGVYVVERTAKPLTGYSATTLTGSANQGVKTLSGTASTLGIGTPGGGGPGPSTPVSLRARANGMYVQASNGGAGPLQASVTAIGLWEQFDMIDLGGGNIALRARVNNQVVCAEQAGAQPLIANRAAVGPWETFALIRNPDGTVSLRAQANGMYVVAENAGAAPLIANRAAIGPWEKFELIGA